MPLVRSVQHGDYWPAYGTLLVTDDEDESSPPDESWPEDDLAEQSTPLDEHLALADVGAFTSAGIGWLHGSAADATHLLLMELHDRQPDDDREDWADVARTPYISRTGLVVPGMVAGGPEPEFALRLDGAGTYLVQVSCRPRAQHPADLDPIDDEPPSEAEQTWRLQFWPTREPAPLPVRLRRQAGQQVDRSGWDSLFPWLYTLLNTVLSAQHRADAEGSDVDPAAPVDPEPGPLIPTGHADLDAAAAQQLEQYLQLREADRAQRTDLAHRLGLPHADTVGTARDLLLTIGLLGDAEHVADGGHGPVRYRPTVPSVSPRSLLALTADEEAAMTRADQHSDVGRLLDELVALARWAEAGDVAVGIAELADRLLASPAAVREALAVAVDDGALTVTPTGAAADGPLRLAVVPDPTLTGHVDYPDELTDEPDDKQSDEWTSAEDGSGAWYPVMMGGEQSDAQASPEQLGNLVAGEWFMGWADGAPQPRSPEVAIGAPARAGYLLGDGRIVVPRDAHLRELAEVPGATGAWQVADGVLVRSAESLAVVTADGAVRPIALPVPVDSLRDPAIDRDGRRAYIASWQGRRRGLGTHHVLRIDLGPDGGTVADLGWPERDLVYVIGPVGDDGTLLVADPSSAIRWRPPAAPERLPSRISYLDRTSGAALGRGAHRPIVLRPDGTAVEIPIQVTALVPGASAAVSYRFEGERWAVTVVPLGDVAGEPRIVWFDVNGLDQHAYAEKTVVWEDADRAVVLDAWSGLDSALRLDVRTGHAERLLVPDAGPGARLIEPLPAW